MKLITTILIFLVTISLWATDNSKIVSEESISLKNEVIRFSLLEGYFRTNAFYRNNFDLDSYYIENASHGDETIYGTSRYNPSLEELKGNASDISTVSYNLRFRLSPSIQVGEYLKAVTTFDIFENTLFGDDYKSQLFGKEGYLVAKSPFGLFKIGRMANNWGLGIFRNDGKGKFSNYGTYVDQFMFEKEMPISIFKHFKAGLAYEVNNSSVSARELYNVNRNYDLDDRDDSTSYSIYLSDSMKGDLLDEYLDLGKTRFNWEFVYNYNSNDMTSLYNDNDTNDRKFSIESISSTYHTFDLYASMFVGNSFKLESELLVKMGDYKTMDDSDETLFQTLFVVEDELSFLQKTVGAGLDFGLAYTDDSQKDSNDPYVNLFGEIDSKNRIFDNDYDIDLIFFKEIARATNLYFIKPHVKWRINRELSVDLWSVTTFAFASEDTFGKDPYLGTELDLKVQFLNRDGLNFGVMAGFYLPGKGMDYLGKDKERSDEGATVENLDKTANYATSIQAFMILKF